MSINNLDGYIGSTFNNELVETRRLVATPSEGFIDAIRPFYRPEAQVKLASGVLRSYSFVTLTPLPGQNYLYLHSDPNGSGNFVNAIEQISDYEHKVLPKIPDYRKVPFVSFVKKDLDSARLDTRTGFNGLRLGFKTVPSEEDRKLLSTIPEFAISPVSRTLDMFLDIPAGQLVEGGESLRAASQHLAEVLHLRKYIQNPREGFNTTLAKIPDYQKVVNSNTLFVSEFRLNNYNISHPIYERAAALEAGVEIADDEQQSA